MHEGQRATFADHLTYERDKNRNKRDKDNRRVQQIKKTVDQTVEKMNTEYLSSFQRLTDEACPGAMVTVYADTSLGPCDAY